MMANVRYIVLWALTSLILIVLNGLIFQKEMLVANGQPIFLELAPRDPRSLLQGDYMVLNYVLAGQARGQQATDGYLVLKRDAQNIAEFVRLHDEQTPLSVGELLLRYRQRGDEVRLGAESFFFQEGQAKFFQDARYAELRVDASGESVLVGLRGPNLERLGP